MESGRQGCSETSSEVNDRQIKEDTATTTNKRSYECTFCKRGFTNAQALGGHMNIHRKDRAKAKQSAGTSSKVYEDYTNPNYAIPPVSSDHHQPGNYYSGLEANQRGYDMYFQSSSVSNPRQSQGYSYHRGPGPRSSMSMNDEELWGANLSLRIGSNPHVQQNQVLNKEDNLDLELRLGHDP